MKYAGHVFDSVINTLVGIPTSRVRVIGLERRLHLSQLSAKLKPESSITRIHVTYVGDWTKFWIPCFTFAQSQLSWAFGESTFGQR